VYNQLNSLLVLCYRQSCVVYSQLNSLLVLMLQAEFRQSSGVAERSRNGGWVSADGAGAGGNKSSTSIPRHPQSIVVMLQLRVVLLWRLTFQSFSLIQHCIQIRWLQEIWRRTDGGAEFRTANSAWSSDVGFCMPRQMSQHSSHDHLLPAWSEIFL